ncbi:hypothetical protein O181_094065 [Austropuccinia psidii MF-1]|uniref:Uncharacterized protein n=1 Tax=Austropuccinia psidii MF-1 TaxID=1389203 RepID=A0A9Q3J2W7_9BASI|nr:hypothetical protein [Austropuccinia psidii MF-1]
MANLANDYGYGQIAIYWIWHRYAILRSKRVAFHGCDKLKQEMTTHEQNLEALLHKFNLQDNAIKNSSSKFKGTGKKIQRFCSKSFNQPTPQKENLPNLLENNANTKLKTTRTPNKILQKKSFTPPQKRIPNQLLQSEIPEAFQPTKVIKHSESTLPLLWGLIYQDSIPISLSYTLLKELNTCFSFLSDVVTQSESPNILPLVPLVEILTLRNTPPGKKRIGNTIIHMSDFSIKYVFASLERLGICQWASDLHEASDTLYNKAFRISAITKSCQIAISGAYKYMNINLMYLESIQLLTSV